jgi:GDP-mannose 6-dehydrogenase
VLNTGEREIGLFGLTFKEGTDDLRESPALAFAETLLGKGAHLTIYEPTISHETIHGANLDFVEKTIPHVWRLLTPDLADLLRCKVVVLLKKVSEFEKEALQALGADQICIDFAGSLREDELRARTRIFGMPYPEASLV